MASDNDKTTNNIIRGEFGEGPGCGRTQRRRSRRGGNPSEKGQVAAMPIVICEAAAGAGGVCAAEGMEAARLEGPQPRPAPPSRPVERPQVRAWAELAWQEAG